MSEFYAFVTCHGVDTTIAPACGSVGLTEEQYDEQMSQCDDVWRCPHCRAEATFDDAKYEEIHGIGSLLAEDDEPAF